MGFLQLELVGGENLVRIDDLWETSADWQWWSQIPQSVKTDTKKKEDLYKEKLPWAKPVQLELPSLWAQAQTTRQAKQSSGPLSRRLIIICKKPNFKSKARE